MSNANSDDPEDRTPTEVESGTGAGDRDDRGRDPRNESTQISNEERRRHTPFISAIVAALGAWVALSVLLYDFAAAELWNNVLVGAVVFVAGPTTTTGWPTTSLSPSASAPWSRFSGSG